MVTLNFEQARHNMIEQQIRTWNVLDDKVLELIERIPREDFVPEAYREHAFSDISIPLGNNEMMLPPRLEAHLIQALDVQPQDSVLEVGTGSGYVTALLASQARHVFSVDIDEQQQLKAQENLRKYQLTNVTLETGDASQGWGKQNAYDVIAITGSLPLLPEAFQNQLNVGGRLFAIVGDAPLMEAILITRTGEKEFTHKVLFETEVPALQNAPQPERFAL